jgi:tetratricopeptide (TPR) repeat protein
MRHIDRIQKYLDGEMKGDELKKFKDDLQKDPELVQELDLHRSLDGIILTQDEERFRKKLDEAYKEYKIKSAGNDNPKPSRKKEKQRLYIAVSFAAGFILAIIVYVSGIRKESNDSIFNKYLISYTGEQSSRNLHSSLSSPDTIERAINLYNQNNYSEASQLFNQILQASPENTEAQFYNGLCFIYLNEFERAITSFDKVLNRPYNYFQEYSKWYLVMCYVRTNQNETAKILLQEIASGNGFFSNDAKKVLRKLR